MNPLRVAQIVPGMSGGGMERMAADLSLSLRSRGHVVELFWGSYPGIYADRLASAGLRVHDCRPGKLRIPAVPVRLTRALRAFQPDILHAHSGIWYPASVAAAALHRPLIFTDHGRYPPERWVDLALQRAWNVRRTSQIVAVSRALAGYLSDHLRLVSPPRVVENGIDLAPYSSADPARRSSLRAEWGFNEADVVVVMLGRLEPVKNVEGLLDAISRAGTVSPLRAVLLGTGALEDALRSRASRLGLEHRVRFLGFRQDVPECLFAADILAMPSLTEGLPISLLEGMAARLPVIASEVGGIPAALGDPRAGLLVPVRDTSALAAGLTRLAGDIRLRRVLGSLARQRAAAFTVERMTVEYEEIYRNCVHRR